MAAESKSAEQAGGAAVDLERGSASPWKRSRSSRAKRFFSPRNIGAIYVWIAIIILFSIISPDVFPTSQTLKSIVNEYAITGIVALSLVVALSAGVYDLSIGFTVGFSGVLLAHLLNTTSLNPILCALISMGACVLIGLLNALVVVVLNINSFIGTLGTGAIIGSITTAISADQTVTISGNFSKLSSTDFSGFTLPVLYMLILMVALGYWLERTQSGRQIYATGFDRETARLTGAPVRRLTVIALLTSATISGFAGLILAARISAGSPGVGSSYLIPAFSAAFLGATQLRGGRFNPWGTVIGVLLLGTGNVGLLVSGGPTWTPELFTGVVLIAAVGLTAADNEQFRAILMRWRRRRAVDDEATR
jgi:ribose transport system permease protein